MSFSPCNAELSAPMSTAAAAIDNQREGSFASLGNVFLTRLPAAPLMAPYVVGFAPDVAAMLGFDASLAGASGFADYFAGNTTREWPAASLP